MFADTKNFIVRRVDPIRWELMKPLVYEGRTQTFVVPEGYVTDFASVPWFVQWFLRRTGVWTLAAVLHDFLITYCISAGLVSSRDADGMFRRVLREEGTGFVRRWLMWAGVRLAAPFNAGRRPSGLWRDAPALAAVVLSLAAAVAAFALAVRSLAALVARA
jgi:hypothetical protein